MNSFVCIIIFYGGGFGLKKMCNFQHFYVFRQRHAYKMRLFFTRPLVPLRNPISAIFQGFHDANGVCYCYWWWWWLLLNFQFFFHVVCCTRAEAHTSYVYRLISFRFLLYRPYRVVVTHIFLVIIDTHVMVVDALLAH